MCVSARSGSPRHAHKPHRKSKNHRHANDFGGASARARTDNFKAAVPPHSDNASTVCAHAVALKHIHTYGRTPIRTLRIVYAGAKKTNRISDVIIIKYTHHTPPYGYIKRRQQRKRARARQMCVLCVRCASSRIQYACALASSSSSSSLCSLHAAMSRGAFSIWRIERAPKRRNIIICHHTN